MVRVNETASGITFAVKIQPRARRNAIVGEMREALKIAVTAPPIEGRANRACIEFLHQFLQLPPSSISIASGQSSRNKVVRVTGISAAELRARLGL